MTRSVLIVDDEPNVRLSYRAALDTEGFEVREASKGSEALAELAAFRFDLAIMDLRMPEMDGLKLLERIRELGNDTPVVIATAFGDVPQAVRAMKLGAIDFLQKPLTPSALRNMVWEVISRHAEPSPIAKEDQFEIHAQAAKRLINQRKFQLAKEHIVRALELNNYSSEIFNLAGVLYEMLEDYTAAQRNYSQAMRLDKNNVNAQQNMHRLKELLQFGSSNEPFHLGERDS